jgi:hypothetical protein
MWKNLFRRLPGFQQLAKVKDAIYQISDTLTYIKEIDLFRLCDFDLLQHPRYGDPKRLLRYQLQVCSQNGEDGIIHEIFRRIGTTNRIFAEVGVGNGCENNTAFLLSLGWTGYWFDGNDNFLAMVQNRPDIGPSALQWTIAFVDRENIADLFRQRGVPIEIDLLSLDIDQNTFYAWEGLRDYRPRVVVIEYNSAIPPDVNWKVHYDPQRVWDRSQNFGASLKALELFGQELGYCLVGCDIVGANAFFVRSDLVGDSFAEPFTSENHFEPSRYSMSFRRSHRNAILDRMTCD